jgi:hypothetical protein
MAYRPMKLPNIDLVSVQLADALAETSPLMERPGSSRANETIHLFHQVRDALIQSERDRGHALPR